MSSDFNTTVGLKYQIYNSLFLGLPFDSTQQTGTHLPLLLEHCQRGLSQKLNPLEILNQFIREAYPQATAAEQCSVLFNVIQYIERQVVLFDSIEDAMFDQINDLQGEGTINHLIRRVQSEQEYLNLLNKLESFNLHLVLTAHPTQFYPRSILSIISMLAAAIKHNDLSQINDLLIQLGKTPFLKNQKPTPLDEAFSLIWYLENIFYSSITTLVCDLQCFLKKANLMLKNKKLITLGFWPGGDRDGNPNVDNNITLAVISELKKATLRCYYRDIIELSNKLTFRVTEDLLLKIANNLYKDIHSGNHFYTTPTALLSDLEQVRDSLIRLHSGLFIEELDRVILSVELFGFHFAALDIRQDSRVHTSLVQKVLAQQNIAYASTMPEQEIITKLTALKTELSSSLSDDPIEQDLMESFKTILSAQKSNGTESCNRYIISNCQSALNVLEVLKLASWSTGLDNLPIDIIPLFESISDLGRAPEIMSTLYENEYYLKHLQNRGQQQIIMLGFSDGTKDGGYMAANWAIFRAKERLSQVAQSYGIKLIFFDGRGGPPARGGGNTHKFYAALGSNIENDAIHLTIQGQTISSNFGTTTSARFNIEQLLTAGVEQAVFSNQKARLTSSERDLLETLSDLSLKAYLELKHDPDILNYLQELGTLNYYGLTNISSRPTKRGSNTKLTLADLRAIPFVGTWTQLKQNVPGYYGLGSALEKLQHEGKLDDLRKLYQHNLFFKTLIDNSMQVLTKTNFELTQHCAQHPRFASLWNKIKKEYQQTTELLLKLSDSETLMANNINSRASIQIREKMVLPLLIIQQACLQNLSATQSLESHFLTKEISHKLILRTMFGIINAGRNSV